MTIDQLRYFITICKLQTLKEAANELLVAESSLSSSMKKLEEECGFKLFERSNKGIIITYEGRLFYDQVQELIDHYDKVQKNLHTFVRSEETISFGIASVVSAENTLKKLLLELLKEYPDCRYSITEKSSKDILLDLDWHLLDYVLIPYADLNSSSRQYRHKEISINIPLCFCCNVLHPLATMKTVTPKEISGLPLLFREGVTTLEKDLEEEFAQSGCYMNIAGHLDQMSTMLSLVKSNLGVAFLPAEVIKDIPEIIGIPFYMSHSATPLLESNISIVWRDEDHPDSFIRKVEDFIYQFALPEE